MEALKIQRFDENRLPVSIIYFIFNLLGGVMASIHAAIIANRIPVKLTGRG